MTGRGCKVFLSSMLKFLNYLQTFVGVTIILFLFWMFSQWNHHYHIPSPSAPSSESAYSSMLNLHGSDVLKNRKLVDNSKHILFNKLVGLTSSHLEARRSSSFEKLPPPWFIHSSMSTGITLCPINFSGYIAAETINGCCLFPVSYWVEQLQFILGCFDFVHGLRYFQVHFIIALVSSPLVTIILLLSVYVISSKSGMGDQKIT